MTSDRALKDAILAETKPNPRARPRSEARRGVPFIVTLLLRAAMIVVMAIVLRTLMYTDQGQALLQHAAEQVAVLIAPEDAAGTAPAPHETVPIESAVAAQEAAPVTGVTMLEQSAIDGRPAVRAMPGSQTSVRRISE